MTLDPTREALRDAARTTFVRWHGWMCGAETFDGWLNREFPSLPALPEPEYPWRVVRDNEGIAWGWYATKEEAMSAAKLLSPDYAVRRIAYVEEVSAPPVTVEVGGVVWTRETAPDGVIGWKSGAYIVRAEHLTTTNRTLFALLEEKAGAK